MRNFLFDTTWNCESMMISTISEASWQDCVLPAVLLSLHTNSCSVQSVKLKCFLWLGRVHLQVGDSLSGCHVRSHSITNKQKKEHQSMYRACTSCSSWRRSTCQRLRWRTSTPPLSILTSSITIWYSAATAKDYSTSFVLLRMWLATICHVSGTCAPLGFWGG